ncbi:ester cyclase [Streptomyces triticirhizae]|nr:ester cyclase [Streptomyces triticirhizae]
MSALTEYIDAWEAGDPARVADAVAEDCVITEC